MKNKKLLDILTAARMADSLEASLRKNREYKNTLKQQNIALKKWTMLNLAGSRQPSLTWQSLPPTIAAQCTAQ